jgi:hypothetical protein
MPKPGTRIAFERRGGGDFEWAPFLGFFACFWAGIETSTVVPSAIAP